MSGFTPFALLRGREKNLTYARFLSFKSPVGAKHSLRMAWIWDCISIEMLRPYVKIFAMFSESREVFDRQVSYFLRGQTRSPSLRLTHHVVGARPAATKNCFCARVTTTLLRAVVTRVDPREARHPTRGGFALPCRYNQDL